MSCFPDCVNCKAMDIVGERIQAAGRARDEDALFNLLEECGKKSYDGNRLARMIVDGRKLKAPTPLQTTWAEANP